MRLESQGTSEASFNTKIAALNLPQCSQTQQLIQFLTLLPTKKLLFVTFMQLSLSYLRIEREQNK